MSKRVLIRITFAVAVVTFIITISILAVAQFGPLPVWVYKNEPLEPELPAGKVLPSPNSPTPPHVKRAQLKNWHAEITAQDKPRAFIGIAISGGGSRAATFGLATLRELDRLGILDHTSAISSVSGGSLPAAYYALFRPSSEADWDAAQKTF